MELLLEEILIASLSEIVRWGTWSLESRSDLLSHLATEHHEDLTHGLQAMPLHLL